MKNCNFLIFSDVSSCAFKQAFLEATRIKKKAQLFFLYIHIKLRDVFKFGLPRPFNF